MRCVCAGDDSDDDVFGNASSKQPENIYDTDDDVVDLEQQSGLEPAFEQGHPLDNHEMVGSTKSLIPLSPTEDSGTSEQHFVDEQDEKAVKCDVPEKPLVIL